MSSEDRIVEFLRRPASYPHPADPVTFHETHISRVFLAGDFVYKLKKPVDLGFLDYSSAERRRHFCEEEVRLNRRLARSVYIGVVALREDAGRLALDVDGTGRGEEIDCLVRMRRLPADAMLDSLIERGAATRAHVDRLLDVLVPFYRDAPRSSAPPESAAERVRATIRSNLDAARDEVAVLSGPGRDPAARLEVIRSAQLSFLELAEELFVERARGGWVRDGHGDLRSDHVGYIPDCVVIDCIEFNADFRVIDVASDLAFLAMDLEFRGARELAAHLVARYEALSGDTGFRRLLPFYFGYRALVRAKVDAIRLSQGGLGEKPSAELRERALRYLDLAAAAGREIHRPALILVGGLSGTGKSTLARLLGERLGAPVLRSDVVRKELAGQAPESGAPAPYGSGLYSPEHSRRTYSALAERAGACLARGASVIVDATFQRREDRERLRRTAAAAGKETPCIHLECRAPAAIAAQRMARRRQHGGDPSDATAEIQAAQLDAYETPAPGEAEPIDTTGAPEEALRKALSAVRRRATLCGPEQSESNA